MNSTIFTNYRYFRSFTTKFFVLSVAMILLNGMTYAQVSAGNQDLSTGTAVLADGSNVKLYQDSRNGKGSELMIHRPITAAGEELKPGTKNAVTDVVGKGYADMQRLTRNVEQAHGTYVQPEYLNGRYQGVIDYGITRDANWSTVYTVADDSAANGKGVTTTGAAGPGIASHKNWGSADRQAAIGDFLKGYSSSDGYIDNSIYKAGQWGVFASTAELYGSAQMNAAGGMFDQLRARGYDAGTNYREGGLIHMDKKGYGVIGQSGGFYFDEGGQYTMDVHGNITFNTDRSNPSKNPAYSNPKTGAQNVAYDDWNQHGLVMTGLDLIAYTTSFDARNFNEAAFIYGNFTVLGDFLDIYINGNKIAHNLLGLDSFLQGTGNALGEYSMMLNLALIDVAFWNANGLNDISFMVRTMSVWELGLEANTTYAKEMGVNYFSAGIAYGYVPGVGGGCGGCCGGNGGCGNGGCCGGGCGCGGNGGGNEVPEPATLALMGLGLAGLGLARARRNRK